MRALVLSACVLALAAGQAAAQSDPLARARMLYNQREFDAAVAAADEAGLVTARTDSADLIAARALLEKYRESAEPDDLQRARDRLRRIVPEHLPPPQRSELVVGLGEALYLDDAPGAAAELFDSLINREENGFSALGPDARERVLDWWASALDREARGRPDAERQGVYGRIRDRMRLELAAWPSSGAASYWLAAAALAQGDAQGAWDAALAGWLRAPLAADHGAALRGDLDLLVEHGIIPERARALAQAVDVPRAEWAAFKAKWEKLP
jgi:hypothetical protein